MRRESHVRFCEKLGGIVPQVYSTQSLGIVRKKLWSNINQADEDRALGALRRYRVENPDRFRIAV